MLETVARICGAVDVPVTADVEAGYDNPTATARAVVQAGAVGLNIEDIRGRHMVALQRQVADIRAIRAATDLVINARTDVFLRAIGDEETRFDRAVERLNAYLHAGADCAFAPGVRDRACIGRLATTVRGPLNILAVDNSPSVSDLEQMGVARVSVGSGPMRAMMTFVRRLAEHLRDHGVFDMFSDAISYAEANELIGRRQL
jgi:2-methylisocitrate lyase-like PEP mutase family enzyme